jgi:hypothetical protein
MLFAKDYDLDYSTLQRYFPKLRIRHFTKSSDADGKYTCLSMAVGIDQFRVWPSTGSEYYWPPLLPVDTKVEVIVAFFAYLGYKAMTDHSRIRGQEKVAIYAYKNSATHVARQTFSGEWVSKLGTKQDIIHSNLECLEGRPSAVVARYGTVKVILGRTIEHKRSLRELRRLFSDCKFIGNARIDERGMLTNCKIVRPSASR